MGYGIDVKNANGGVIFSTNNSLFQYMGYKDYGLGTFDFSISVPTGRKGVFIPVLLRTENPDRGSNGIPNAIYLNAVNVSNNRIKGEVKSNFMNNDKSMFLRLHYGIY